jgi:PhzF family phenazine biosynthesis protein
MKIYHVDSFTDNIFSGNPAGVCILESERSAEWMQNVAMELNLSETAFLVRNGNVFNLRWFAPAGEVDLCGHATLASAHILSETGLLGKKETASFMTKSGLLKARNKGDIIELDFPVEDDSATDMPEFLVEALGTEPLYVGKNRMDYIVELSTADEVADLKPELSILKKIDTRGVIVTARSINPEYDFVSRFFAPRLGIDEDPVTGSAHCCLGPYWQRKLDKSEFNAYQVSKRGGSLNVRVDNGRVFIGGKAVTVLVAEMNAD